MIRCTCPSCQAALELPIHLANTQFGCPSCGKSFLVPGSEAKQATAQSFMDRLLHVPDNPQTGAVPAPPPATKVGSSHPPALPVPSSPEPPPTTRRPPDAPRAWLEQDEFRDPREFEEDDYSDDEFDDAESRGGAPRHQAIRSAIMGMSLSMIGLIGILIGIAVFVISSRRGPGGLNGLEIITLILSIGALLSFAFTLMGIVFSSRGMDRRNDYNRGMAVAGLVCGILGLTLSVLFGSFYFFCGLMVRMMPF